MRHITKSNEPEEFSDWKDKYPGATYKDLRDEASFAGAEVARKALRVSLLSEQKGICCYCERRIVSGDYHVEHFKPKGTGLFPELQLEYSNLHASCGVVPSGCADEHCGHKKKDVFSNDLVSPLEPDCESHFIFDCDGGIDGSDKRGVETVKILNLDSGLLKRSRRVMIEYFEELDETEFEEELKNHLNPLSNPLADFYSTIEYLSSHGLLHPNS